MQNDDFAIKPLREAFWKAINRSGYEGSSPAALVDRDDGIIIIMVTRREIVGFGTVKDLGYRHRVAQVWP